MDRYIKIILVVLIVSASMFCWGSRSMSFTELHNSTDSPMMAYTLTSGATEIVECPDSFNIERVEITDSEVRHLLDSCAIAYAKMNNLDTLECNIYCCYAPVKNIKDLKCMPFSIENTQCVPWGNNWDGYMIIDGYYIFVTPGFKDAFTSPHTPKEERWFKYGICGRESSPCTIWWFLTNENGIRSPFRLLRQESTARSSEYRIAHRELYGPDPDEMPPLIEGKEM